VTQNRTEEEKNSKRDLAERKTKKTRRALGASQKHGDAEGRLLLVAPPPPLSLHSEKEGLDLREKVNLILLERGQREGLERE
jgi:hypothetical protein